MESTIPSEQSAVRPTILLLASYKGQVVEVFHTSKHDICLGHKDLVDIINVSKRILEIVRFPFISDINMIGLHILTR